MTQIIATAMCKISKQRERATREPLAPYNGTSPEMGKLAAHLKTNHVYAFSRFNMLWVCPPLIVTEDELRYGLDIIDAGLDLVDQALTPELTATGAGR